MIDDAKVSTHEEGGEVDWQPGDKTVGDRGMEIT